MLSHQRIEREVGNSLSSRRRCRVRSISRRREQVLGTHFSCWNEQRFSVYVYSTRWDCTLRRLHARLWTVVILVDTQISIGEAGDVKRSRWPKVKAIVDAPWAGEELGVDFGHFLQICRNNCCCVSSSGAYLAYWSPTNHSSYWLLQILYYCIQLADKIYIYS